MHFKCIREWLCTPRLEQSKLNPTDDLAHIVDTWLGFEGRGQLGHVLVTQEGQLEQSAWKLTASPEPGDHSETLNQTDVVHCHQRFEPQWRVLSLFSTWLECKPAPGQDRPQLAVTQVRCKPARVAPEIHDIRAGERRLEVSGCRGRGSRSALEMQVTLCRGSARGVRMVRFMLDRDQRQQS